MTALGTRTVGEVVDLAARSLRLVQERGPVLVAWFSLGWAVHQAGLSGSALLGLEHPVLANTLFVLAVVAKLVALVLMVDAVRPRRPASLVGHADEDGRVPRAVFARERSLDVVTSAVGPFLAVYAVWGFIDDEVSALFYSNYVLQGLGGVDTWSISLDRKRLPIYLGLAAVGWLLRAVVRLVERRTSRDRRPPTWVACVGVLAEGVWALGLFVVLLVLVRIGQEWLFERVVWAQLSAAGNAVLGVLPSWTLPFGPTVRELARGLVTTAPGVLATVLGLPLMWLALAATVYGWREVRAADLVVGTRVADRLQRLERLGATPTGRLVLLATDDLRTKYLPVAQALRVVGRAGPRVIGAYLLLATVISALENLLRIGVTLVVGPQSQAVRLLLEPAQDLLVSLPVTVFSVALYSATFSRALARPVSTAPLPAPALSDLRVSGGAPTSGRRR